MQRVPGLSLLLMGEMVDVGRRFAHETHGSGQWSAAPGPDVSDERLQLQSQSQSTMRPCNVPRRQCLARHRHSVDDCGTVRFLIACHTSVAFRTAP